MLINDLVRKNDSAGINVAGYELKQLKAIQQIK